MTKETALNRLDEYIRDQLGMEASSWSEEMKIHAVINAAERMQRDLLKIAEQRNELANMLSRWNNEYYDWTVDNSSQN